MLICKRVDNLVLSRRDWAQIASDDEPRFTLDVTGLFADTNLPLQLPRSNRLAGEKASPRRRS
jgi:hypothetical protein